MKSGKSASIAVVYSNTAIFVFELGDGADSLSIVSATLTSVRA